MRRESTPPDETYTIYCPRLGHQIGFAYCRSENRGLPCFSTIDCWYDHFLVEELLREQLSRKNWDQAFSEPQKPKLVILLELIEQARKTGKEDASER